MLVRGFIVTPRTACSLKLTSWLFLELPIWIGVDRGQLKLWKVKPGVRKGTAVWVEILTTVLQPARG